MEGFCSSDFGGPYGGVVSKKIFLSNKPNDDGNFYDKDLVTGLSLSAASLAAYTVATVAASDWLLRKRRRRRKRSDGKVRGFAFSSRFTRKRIKI